MSVRRRVQGARGYRRRGASRVCEPSTSGVTHVVAYHRQPLALRGTVDMLLDAASESFRASESGNAGCCFRRCPRRESSIEPFGGTASQPRRPDLGIEFGLCSLIGLTRPRCLGKLNRPGTRFVLEGACLKLRGIGRSYIKQIRSRNAKTACLRARARLRW